MVKKLMDKPYPIRVKSIFLKSYTSAPRKPRNAYPSFFLQKNPQQSQSDNALPSNLGVPTQGPEGGPPDNNSAEESQRQPWNEEILVMGSQTDHANHRFLPF